MFFIIVFFLNEGQEAGDGKEITLNTAATEKTEERTVVKLSTIDKCE